MYDLRPKVLVLLLLLAPPVGLWFVLINRRTSRLMKAFSALYVALLFVVLLTFSAEGCHSAFIDAENWRQTISLVCTYFPVH